jgi:hypothetical protein
MKIEISNFFLFKYFENSMKKITGIVNIIV